MRIVVAMSGGVDSSVVAALLVEAGHEVIGVTLQLYDHGAATGRKGACCAGQDIHDARRVADRLGIAHYVIDAEARFARAVIADFADAYAAGETPVPCVRCNQTVKFTDLTALADGLGAERLATGHYVRRVDGAAGPELHRARDPARDQSWFLFATTRAQLGRRAVPAGRHGGQGRGARPCGAARPAGRGQARQPGHLLRPRRQLRRYRRAAATRCAGAGRDRRPRMGACWAATTASRRFTVGQAQAARLGRRRAAASSWRWTRRAGASWSARAAPARARSWLREVNWLVEPPSGPRALHGKAPRARGAAAGDGHPPTATGAIVRLDAPACRRPARRASSTTATACWAAASSRPVRRPATG